MSFSTDFKSEILANNNLESAEEKIAFLSSVLRQNGSIHISKNLLNIEIESEFEGVILRVAYELKALYDLELNIKRVKDGYLNRQSFLLQLPPTATKQIANDTGCITYSGDKAVSFFDDSDCENFNEKQIKAYLLGIATTSAYISVPMQSKSNSELYEGSYSLEMRFNNENTADLVMNYFAQYDIFLKKVSRNETFTLYLRDSEMISDFMAFFGGHNAVLVINDILVTRSFRNDINRVRNCELANIDKSVEAGQKQYLAIKLIDEKIGLDNLSDKLKEIAEIRLENPDFTLEQVAEAVGISKSGINHRFRKIMEIAKSLQEKE